MFVGLHSHRHSRTLQAFGTRRRSLDLAPSSTRSAGPPEIPEKPQSFLRSRPAASQNAEVQKFLKELAEAREAREREARGRGGFVSGARRGATGGVGRKSERTRKGCCNSYRFLQVALAMALLSLALVTFLAVFHNSAAPPVDASSDGKEVNELVLAFHTSRVGYSFYRRFFFPSSIISLQIPLSIKQRNS